LIAELVLSRHGKSPKFEEPRTKFQKRTKFQEPDSKDQILLGFGIWFLGFSL
jgi:hypothetical protein